MPFQFAPLRGPATRRDSPEGGKWRHVPACPARSAPARGPARPAREAVRFRLEHFERAAEYKVRFIVHERPLGLIGAKRTGADAAWGGIIVFFDCHVKPAPDYWVPFVENVEKNYRRVVVPISTR